MEAAEAFLYAEGWQFFWLAWALIAAIAALYRCTDETVIVSLMLLGGWFLTNLFWDIRLVYIVSDAVFMTVAFGLWLQCREGHILFVVTMYGTMLVTHLIGPPMPGYMVALNLLFGGQLGAISHDAWAGRMAKGS